MEDGALVEPLAVSLHGVTLAQIAPGAKVLVQGAGPIGVGAALGVLGNCVLADTFYPAQAMFKQVRIQGSMIYSVREFETVARSFDAGHVEPRKMVTETLGYAALPAAFEALRTTRHQCKVMVNPWA